ncbi:GNAT family N-acetyltransferase [Desulfolutivibrio sp.]|uniref:GNAT family N-acetyltransferase n=1 Tax=Desulfolutivibrio sp. TaxID=2773296 RepID=UPI002F96474C
MNLRLVALDNRLDRKGFSCGEEALDRYFREGVAQDVKRRVASCFVALGGTDVAGFYTLACAGLPVSDLPEAITRRLPRYPTLPAVRIGRLAVAQTFQGRGVGSVLLVDAMHRALRMDVAGFTLVVDAKNEHAASFYEHHGFMRLVSRPGTLFLPLATVQKALDL